MAGITSAGANVSGIATSAGSVLGGGGGSSSKSQLIFGGIMNTNGQYAWANGDSAENQLSGLDPGSQQTVLYSGTINTIAWTSSSGSTDTVMGIWVEGVEVDTFTLTAASGQATIDDISLDAGDLVAISKKSGTNASFMTIKLGVTSD